MDISRLIQTIVSAFRPPNFELDYMLESWIRDALLEDANVQPPACTWEQLCQVIMERKVAQRVHGMWVLDEPLRDPPESSPMILTGLQFKRAKSLYESPDERWQRRKLPLDWSNVMPTFAALVNL